MCIRDRRPAYQGANEISQVWATQAIRMCAEYLPRAVADLDDDEARSKMLLAASFAGIGFGNAGVTIPHGMSYPVAGMAHSRGYHADGYPTSHAMVPHGMAVILNAPAAFRFTAPTNPGLHLYAAELMGADTRDVAPEDAGLFLSKVIVDFIRSMGIPNGLRAVGYGTQDIEDLVQGTLPQKRVLNISPRPVTPEDLAQLFLESLVLWEEKR
jgi:hydroxyacid-oxoacid transhydrogenase